MVRLTGMASEDSSPVGEGPGGRTVEPLSSGGTRGMPASIGDVDELLTTGKSLTTNRPRDPRVTLPARLMGRPNHTAPIPKRYGATWLPKR